MVYFRKRHILCRILVFIVLISFLTESFAWASPFKAELSAQHSSIDKLAPDTEVNNEKFLNTILTIEEICELFRRISIETVPFNDFWREYYTRELRKIFAKRDIHYAENLMIKFHADSRSVYIYSANPRSEPGIVWHIYPENFPTEDPVFFNSGLSPFYSTKLNGLNIALFTGTASVKNALQGLTIQPYSSATNDLEKIFDISKLVEHIIDASKTNETLALLLLELLKTRAVKDYKSVTDALNNIINNENTSGLIKAKTEEILNWLINTKLNAVKELSKEIKSRLDEVRDSLNNLYHQIEGVDADIPSLLVKIRKECSNLTSKLKILRERLKHTEEISYEGALISQAHMALLNTLSYGGRYKEYDILNLLTGIIAWINSAMTTGDLNNLKDVLPRNLKRLESISKLLSEITTYREEIFERYTFFVFENVNLKLLCQEMRDRINRGFSGSIAKVSDAKSTLNMLRGRMKEKGRGLTRDWASLQNEEIFEADMGNDIRLVFIKITGEFETTIIFEHYFKGDELIGYGSSWMVGDGCELIFHIFNEWKEKIDSKVLLTKQLQLLQELSSQPIRKFHIPPDQFDNEDAIQAGAVIFYLKLGFYPEEPQKIEGLKALIGKLESGEMLSKDEVKALTKSALILETNTPHLSGKPDTESFGTGGPAETHRKMAEVFRALAELAIRIREVNKEPNPASVYMRKYKEILDFIIEKYPIVKELYLSPSRTITTDNAGVCLMPVILNGKDYDVLIYNRDMEAESEFLKKYAGKTCRVIDRGNVQIKILYTPWDADQFVKGAIDIIGKKTGIWFPMKIHRTAGLRPFYDWVSIYGYKIESPEEFFEQITSDENKLNTFINEVSEFIFGERSEQVTELFKENVDWVEIKSILEKLIAVNKNAKKLHVFDAGCSHGLEPYSLLILIQDILGEDFGNWDICITAVDKQLGMLNNPLLSRDIPEGTVRPREKDYSRYFIENDRGYKVKPELFQKIRFCYSNLEDMDDYGDSSYDFIMSANTLRYIKEQNKLKVTTHLASHLRPGGYFYIQNFYMIQDRMVDFRDRRVELWIRDAITAAEGYKATPGRNGRSVVLEKPSQDIAPTHRSPPQGAVAECLKDLYANRDKLKDIYITLNNTINPPDEMVRWRRTHEDSRKPFNKKTLRTELNSLVELGFLTKGTLPNLEHVYTITDKLLNAKQWQIDKISSISELVHPSQFPETPETLEPLKKQIDKILFHINFAARFYKSLKMFFVRLFYKLILRRRYLTPQELEDYIMDLINYKPSEGKLPKYTEDDLINIIRVPEEKIKEVMDRIKPKLMYLTYSKILINKTDFPSLIKDNLVLPVYLYKTTKGQKWTIAGYEGADILDKLAGNGEVIKVYALQENGMASHKIVYRYTQPDEKLNTIKRELPNSITIYIEASLYKLLLAFSEGLEKGAEYLQKARIEMLADYKMLLQLLEFFPKKVIPEQVPVQLQKETTAKKMNLDDILSFISDEKNRELIKKAYDIAYKYYGDKIIPSAPRKTTYIEHAIDIADELIRLGGFGEIEDRLSIIDWNKNKDYKMFLAELLSSALVHNVPKTERLSLGPRINEIADKLHKLQNIPYRLQPGYYIHNFYKMVFKELKVEGEYYPFLALLLFADRFVSLLFTGQDEEKDNLQNEIFDIYQSMLEELFEEDNVPSDFMDRAFKITDPKNYEITKRAIEDILGCSYEDAQESLKYIADLVKLRIDPDGDGYIEIDGERIGYKLETRLKGIFSTYLKPLVKPEYWDIKELRDLIGMRIIIEDNDKDKCYAVSDILQIIHWLTYLLHYSDDYISQKKKSGYQSLHEAFQTKEKIRSLKDGTIMEIQIRTQEMHDKATIGEARHGRGYKTKIVRKGSKADKIGKRLLTKDPVENCRIIWNELELDKFKVLRWVVKGEIDTPERLHSVSGGATIADILCRRGINLGDKKIKARVNNDPRNKSEDYVPVNGDLLTISVIGDLEKPHLKKRDAAVLPRTKLFSYILDPYKAPMREVSIGAAKLILAILNDLGVSEKDIEGYIKGLVRGLTGKSTKLQLIDNIIILVQKELQKANKGKYIYNIIDILEDIINQSSGKIRIKKTPYYRDYFINNLAQFADEKEFRYEGAKERDENIIMELLAAIGVNVIDTEEVINYLKEKYKTARTFAPIKKSSKYDNAKLERKGVKDVANITKVLDSGEGFMLDIDIENVGKLKFCVDKRFLDFYGETRIIELIKESIKIRGPDKYKGLDLSKPFYLALLDKSPSIAEDHVANHFIGINKIIFEEFSEQVQRDTLFMISISHELRHEAGFSDENSLAKEDTELFRTILDKIHIFQKNIDEFIDNLILHIDKNAEFLIELKKLYPRVHSLGGNSLLISEDVKKDPYSVQKTRIYETLSYITKFIRKGYPLIFTHGNGPQVYIKLKKLGIDPDTLGGNWENIPSGKLAKATRLTQEWIGKDIKEGLTKLGIPEDRIEIIITHVLVDPKDTEFKKPTKPIGIRPIGEDTRMRVPSPVPIHIIEIDRIAKAILEGKIVICVGGGGIPVVETDKGNLEYINAVIDKDMATALLVRELNEKGINIPQATILTAVDGAKLNYGTPNERHLDVISPEIVGRHYKEGHFEQGEMGPKIIAGILMANLGTEVIITKPECIGKRQSTILPYEKWQMYRQTGFDKKMGFFKDEPYVLACLKEAFELYLQLFGLISKRKEGSEDTTEEAEGISRRIKKLSLDLKIPTYPLYITENHNLREEAREKLEDASSLVIKGNEPAAEASLLAGIDRLSRELTSLLSARITKIKDLKTVVTFDTQNDEYRIIQGQLRNIVVGDKETIFRVKTQKRFKYLWEAFRAIDHEIDGELEEMVFLSRIIKLLSKIKAGIKIEEVQDLMGEVRQSLNDLENVLVIEKDIARFGLLIILRQLELSDLYRVKDTAFIVSRLLEARYNALLNMIKRTHTGRLYALREEVKRRNEELKSRVSSIVSDLDIGNTGGAINSLVNRDYGLLKNKKINAYLREPEFKGVKRLLGFVSVLVKTGRTEKAKETLEIILKKTENARHLAIFVSTFRDMFVNARIKRPEENIIKEDLFVELFKSYLVKANLERGSPEKRIQLAQLWWTRYYQAVFIPLNIPNPRKKTERIPNPVFNAVSEFITTLDISIEKGEFLNLDKYESLVNDLAKKYKIKPGSEDEKQLKIARLTDITQWLTEEVPLPAVKGKNRSRDIFDKLTSREPYTVIPDLRWQKDITAKDIVNFQKYIAGLDLGDEFYSILITKFLYNIIISTLEINDSYALKPLEDLFLLDELESDSFFNHSREFIRNYDYNKGMAEKIIALVEDIQLQYRGIYIDNIKKRCQRLLLIKSVECIKSVLENRNISISAIQEKELEKLLRAPIENRTSISIQALLQELALKIPPEQIFEFLSEITEILDKYLDKNTRENRLEATKSILAGIIEIIPNKDAKISVLQFEDILFELGKTRGLSQVTLQRLMTEFKKGLDIVSHHNEVELLGLDINFLILLALLEDIMKLKRGDIIRVIAEIIFTGEAEKLDWGDLEMIKANLKIDIPDGQTVRYIVKSYLEGLRITEIENILRAKGIEEQFKNIFNKVKQLIATQFDIKPYKDIAPRPPSSLKRLAQIIDFNLGLRRALKSGDILQNNGKILVPEDFYYNPSTLLSNSTFKNIVIPQGNTTIDTGEYLTELGEINSEKNRIVEELKAKDGIREQRHKLPIIDGNALIQRISQGKSLEMTTEGKIRFPFRQREASIIEALNIIADYAKIGHLGLMMSDEMVKVRKPSGEEIEINLKDIIKNLLEQELNMDKKLEIHIFSRNIEEVFRDIERDKKSYGLNEDSHLSKDVLILLDEDMSKDLLTDELRQKMLNNELKVLVKGRYTGLGIAVIMALQFLEIDKIYDGDILSKEAEDILSKFKLTKDEIAKINQEIKDKGFFILPPFITIKQILDEFRMRRVSVEVSV